MIIVHKMQQDNVCKIRLTYFLAAGVTNAKDSLENHFIMHNKVKHTCEVFPNFTSISPQTQVP